MSHANAVNAAQYGLSDDAGINNAQRARIAARYAALIDGMTARRKLDRVNSKLLAGARRQGFIDDMGALTEWAHEWRNGCPVDAVDWEAICGRAAVEYTEKQNAVFRQYQQPAFNAQPFIDAGMILVDGEMVDTLSADELAMWLKAKRHERDGLTLEQLARLLGEPLAHVQIRAERIIEAGYVLAVQGTDAA